MLDYWKLWIRNPIMIQRILNNPKIKKFFTYDEGGTHLGTEGKRCNWAIKSLTPTLLQITGSIHRYWNGGTNENDFSFLNAIAAIQQFCRDFELDPAEAWVINLEFGVNLQLPIAASEIIELVLCFNNRQPIRPYTNRPDCFFIEFEQSDYYFKVYDKGRQYRKQLPGTPNTLRLEVKAMNSRYLHNLGIYTLQDLQQPLNLEALGRKLASTVKGLVLDDDSIVEKDLSLKDRRLYREYSNPRKWKSNKGNTTSTTRYQAARYKEIVETYGSRRIYSFISRAIEEKLRTLSKGIGLAVSLPNL